MVALTVTGQTGDFFCLARADSGLLVRVEMERADRSRVDAATVDWAVPGKGATASAFTVMIGTGPVAVATSPAMRPPVWSRSGDQATLTGGQSLDQGVDTVPGCVGRRVTECRVVDGRADGEVVVETLFDRTGRAHRGDPGGGADRGRP